MAYQQPPPAYGQQQVYYAQPVAVEGAYPQQGYPQQGYPQQGYPPQGYAPQAYAPQPYAQPPGAYAPGTVLVVTQSETPWIVGPCDCCEDVGTCCLGLWCPCVASAYIENERNGKEGCDGCTCFLGFLAQLLPGLFGVFGWACCACYYGSKRGELRNTLGVQGNSCEDCLLHCVWQPCALTQERLEISKRKSQGPPGQVMAMPAGGDQQVNMHAYGNTGKSV